MKKPSVRSVLHAAAVELKSRVDRKGHHLRAYGICGNMRFRVTFAMMGLEFGGTDLTAEWAYIDKLEALRTRVFKRWPQYSGDEAYPVPGDKGRDARDAFNEDYGTASMWSKRAAYGRARRELLDFLIAETAPKVKP